MLAKTENDTSQISRETSQWIIFLIMRKVNRFYSRQKLVGLFVGLVLFFGSPESPSIAAIIAKITAVAARVVVARCIVTVFAIVMGAPSREWIEDCAYDPGSSTVELLHQDLLIRPLITQFATTKIGYS